MMNIIILQEACKWCAHEIIRTLRGCEHISSLNKNKIEFGDRYTYSTLFGDVAATKSSGWWSKVKCILLAIPPGWFRRCTLFIEGACWKGLIMAYTQTEVYSLLGRITQQQNTIKQCFCHTNVLRLSLIELLNPTILMWCSCIEAITH